MKMSDAHQLYLIGNPLGHSCSDVIHNTISECLELPYRYALREIPTEEVGAIADEARRAHRRLQHHHTA